MQVRGDPYVLTRVDQAFPWSSSMLLMAQDDANSIAKS